jgi:hypothetical protein
MKEFAARTFQKGQPDLARDYAPAVMDHAATPVRVEKWQNHQPANEFMTREYRKGYAL